MIQPGQPRVVQILFFLAAPIALPLYALFLAYVNLAGLAAFLIFDLSLARVARRTVTLPQSLFWWISPLLIAVATPLLALHLLAAGLHAVVAGLVSLGRWQTGLRRAPINLVVGALWTGLAVWSVAMAVDGILGLKLVGRAVPGAHDYQSAMRRHLRLRELPPAMQARRGLLSPQLAGLRPMHSLDDPFDIQLDDDAMLFEHLSFGLRARLADFPWYYVPADYSPEGTAHCEFMPGMLLLALLLLPRWPILRGPVALIASAVLRLVGLSLIWTGVLSWRVPVLPPRFDSFADRVLCPLRWFGVEPALSYPPQWYTLNAAVALLLLGAAGLVWWVAWRLHGRLEVPRFYSAFLAARLLQRKRIAFFSVGAVTLCVAMLLIVISVMGGFVDTIRERSNAVLADLVLDGDLRGFPFYDEFLAELRRWPEVRSATAIIRAYGTLRFERNETHPVQIVGIRLGEYCQVNRFGDDLFYERHYPGTTTLAPVSQPFYGYDRTTTQPVLPEPFEAAFQRWVTSQPAEARDEFRRIPGGVFPGPGIYALSQNEKLTPELAGREFPGIIIGRDLLAARRPDGEYDRSERYPRGCLCSVTLIPLSRNGQIVTEAPPSPRFRYIDDSRTGIYEIDSKNVYVDFAVLQDKLGMGALPRSDNAGSVAPRCSQIQVQLARGLDARRLKSRLSAAWREFTDRVPTDPDDVQMMQAVSVATWEELQRGFIDAIQKEKVLVVIMFGVISVVAVFLVLCIFYMIVLEKTRDIGIVKSVGGSAEGVAAVFLVYGGAIGTVGATLGTVVGWTFVHYINAIQDWLARLNPAWRVWSPETYSFDKIPDTVRVSDVVFIGIAAVIASVLGAVVPAIRAARTWPVEALRYE